MSTLKLMYFKVLIVDNILADRKLYEMYVETTFKNIKAAYTQCSNRREAYQAITEYKYDLALIDSSLMSRGFDTKGTDTVQDIRASEKNKDIAVIAFSGSASHEELMMEAGADEFIYRNSVEEMPSSQFADKGPEALMKAAGRDPKSYIVLLHHMGIINVPELEDKSYL